MREGQLLCDTCGPLFKETSMRRCLLVSLLALTACATTGPCLGPPAMPASVPGAVALSPFQNEGAQATCLQAWSWLPQGKAPVGVVIIVHGIRDHALRYTALANGLAELGYAVYAQDMRGHGQSGGSAQRWESLTELRNDVDVLLTEATKRHPGVPVFVYGHSMGGLVATHLALEHPELAGLVLSGAALKLLPGVSGGQKAAAHFFGAIAPGLHAQHVDDTEFVREASAKAELAADPLVVHDDLPARSAAATLDGIEAAYARTPELKLPLLVMHGTVDKATNVEGSTELVERATSTDKTLKLWPGVYHDLLHEPEADQVIKQVTDWVVSHTKR
jgi:lysophospholipase